MTSGPFDSNECLSEQLNSDEVVILEETLHVRNEYYYK